MRKFRYIKKNTGNDSLTLHEIEELRVDYDIETIGFYVLAPLTKDEWHIITSRSSRAADICGSCGNTIETGVCPQCDLNMDESPPA